MLISDSILQDVRRLVAEILELDLAEVRAESLFFDDLGGESIELIELSFHLDKLYGVRVRFQDLAADELHFDDQGRLTADSLALLKRKYPFLKLDGFESRPLERSTAFLTIEAIAGFVQMAVNAKPAATAAAPGP
jgi:acyl carrier protein